MTAAAAYTSRFTDLLAEVQAAGLLDRRRGYYLLQIGGHVLAFAGLWVVFWRLGDTWWQLLVAAALGVVVTQFGFLGHDAAHRQVFVSARANEWTSRLLAGGFAGLSYSWWRTKHNRHHRGPNAEGLDPDIAPGAVAFTPAAVASRRWALTRWLTDRQGWLFFPLLTLEGANLHVSSIRAGLDRSTPRPWRRLELALVTARLGAYVVVVALLLSPGLAAAFVAVQMAVFGLCLGASFAPAHKGMPIVPPGLRLDFLRRQVMVSRNVRGNPVLDWAMGGLNYQIEHHLFPSMPRCNLRRARPLVRSHCRREGVDYVEVGLWRSYALVVDYLNHVGLQARDPFDCPLSAQLRGGAMAGAGTGA